ncbi:MAG TPA: hypothetical protein PLW35_12295, partial [Verrucomicrobiota bacterium]|nr:hypothetical protein [Verrucomicrobiota bacterium]
PGAKPKQRVRILSPKTGVRSSVERRGLPIERYQQDRLADILIGNAQRGTYKVQVATCGTKSENMAERGGFEPPIGF